MRILLFLSAIIIVSKVYSQSKELKRGEDFLSQKNYHAALSEFKKANSIDPENPKIMLRMAQALSETGNQKEAIEIYKKIIEIDPDVTSEFFYSFGTALHRDYNFINAKANFMKSDPNKTNIKITNKRIKECNDGEQLFKKPVDAKIINVGKSINSSYPEYLPKITADGMKLFFTSRRPGSTGSKKADDGLYYEDIYRAINAGGVYGNTEQMPLPINSEDHDALVGISNDGHTIFIYKGLNGGDIYISEYKKGQWTRPVALPGYINTPAFETSATLSPDGKTLYFVRDIDGTNRNIYQCKKTSTNKWSKPAPINAINTPYDEESPFMHPDGKTLYFSSKGHSTMGGYDIFKSEYKSGSWSKPENLGYPINSTSDDLYFVLTASGKTGFYSSARENGEGMQDVYLIRMPITKKNLALVKGKIADKNGKPICADIVVNDNLTGEEISKTSSDCLNGEYLLTLPSGKNYGITVLSEGNLFYSENVFLPENSNYNEIINDVTIQKIEKDVKIILKNIFFDSGQSILKDESKTELNRLAELLFKNPSLRIEISGHTDNLGNAEANQKLSEERAKNVVNFLISKSIQSNRLKAVGYGSNKPIADNSTEKGRQQNRRTEFKIISF